MCAQFADAPYIIEGLTPQRTYDFRFAARNDVGIGGYGGGNQRYTMPMRSVPTEPKILVPNENAGLRDILVNSPYADHYELRWKVPHDNGDPIDNYVIRYCVVSLLKLPQLSINTSFFPISRRNSKMANGSIQRRSAVRRSTSPSSTRATN